MSGRFPFSPSPWRSDSRPGGSSRGAAPGASISQLAFGVYSRSGGRSEKHLLGSSSLVSPSHSLPIFSSPHEAHQPRVLGQASSNSRRAYAGDRDTQLSVPSIPNRLLVPEVNHDSSSPAGNRPHNIPWPPPGVESQGQLVPYADISIPAERPGEVIMAVDVNGKGSLGCAYFDSAENSLSVLQDIPCTELLPLVDVLMVHVEPTVVLLPLKIPDEAIDVFEKRKMSGNGTGKERYILRTLASNELNYVASVDRLAKLPLVRSEQAVVAANIDPYIGVGTGVALEESQNTKVMRLGSFIDLDCVLSIGCAGAVLGQAIRMHNAEQTPRVPDWTTVALLRMFALADFMFVTNDTLASLQVFQSELHPNSLMSGASSFGGGSKESLSIYGLFYPLAGTPQGRVKLRQMFVRPLVNLDKIRERQTSIAILLQIENTEALESISQALRKVGDIRQTLEHLEMGADAPTGSASVDRSVWWVLTRFSLHVLQVRDAVMQLQNAHRLDIIQQVIHAVPIDIIKRIGELVESIVDFEEANASSRITVKWNVDPQLDILKRRCIGLDSLLDEIHASMSQELPEWAQQCVKGVGFWPQMGFFTIVSAGSDGVARYEGQGLEGDQWHVAFAAGGNMCCKNNRMAELDAQFGDPYSGIVDLEIQILHDLACRVLAQAPALSRAADVCGELDCLVALANGARRYRWTLSTMTTENVVSINGGRHPLQELAVPAFIANDCRLRGGHGEDQQIRSTTNVNNEATALVINGPNHSGKSVYIKQTALIVYLAHLGSFVPADHATIGVTDQILTRISTPESVSQNDSAFGTDLKQVAFLLRRATHRSLVVIDEFGKGTTADDGSGLMAGLIDHFSQLGSQNPKVLITTHFHEIFEGGYLQAQTSLHAAHMKVRLNVSAQQKEEQVVFLYQLVPGYSVSSFGSRCAALNGVDNAVVERAEAFVPLLARNEDLGAACAKLSVEDEAQLEEAETIARRFLQLSFQGPSVPHSLREGDRGGCVMGVLERLLRL